jgi:hypothetical protein
MSSVYSVPQHGRLKALYGLMQRVGQHWQWQAAKQLNGQQEAVVK